MREAFARVMQIALLALCLTGCSHQPTELSDEELAESYSSINQLEADNQEPINGPVTLEEAVARALKYNLDLRQRTLERVEKLKQVDSISLSQWPELVAQTRLDRRDTYSGGSSVTILPGGKSVGAESLEASTSSERRVQFADIEFSWNLLDFGLSYVRSQQAANEVMIYREEERKVMNRLMQEVRALYWMALTAQHQIPRLNKLHAKAEEALNEAQQIIDGRVEQPLEPLIYIRNLHGVKRRIEYLISDLESAKIRLGALMNLPPGTPYELAVEADYEIRKFKMETSEMERVALVNRPELRSLMFQKRILADESKATLLELMPGIQMYAGFDYTSNDYVFDRNWASVGTQVSWNLLNVFKYPTQSALIESREEALEAQQLSLSMAVLVQLHVAINKHLSSIRKFETRDEYYKAQRAIVTLMKSQATSGSISGQQLIFEQLNDALAELERDVAHGDMEKGVADLLASMGVDPLPSNFEDTSVEGVARSLDVYWGSLTEIIDSRTVRLADTQTPTAPQQAFSELASARVSTNDPNASQKVCTPDLSGASKTVDAGFTVNLGSFSNQKRAINFASVKRGKAVFDGCFYVVLDRIYDSESAARQSAHNMPQEGAFIRDGAVYYLEALN